MVREQDIRKEHEIMVPLWLEGWIIHLSGSS